MVNNVTRFLDARKVKYTAFETPAEKLGALETARFLNVPPEQVFKTIVVTRARPGKPILAVVPGPNQVDLKRLASLLGEKKSQPADRTRGRAVDRLAGRRHFAAGAAPQRVSGGD